MKNSHFAARSIFLAFGLGISSWAPMVPYIKDKFQFDDAQLGMVLFVFGFGALGVMPLAGWLIHRYGSKNMILWSGTLFSLFPPLLTIAASPLLLSLTLFLFGAASGMMNVSINAQAVEIEMKNAAPLMSGFHCFFSLGGLLGALSISCLLELRCPLPISALVMSSAIWILILSVKKNLITPISHNSQSQTHEKSFISSRFHVLLLGIFCFISFMAEGSMLDWSAEFLHSSKGYPSASAGIGYALFSLSMAFGRLIGDRVIEKLNVFFVFQTGCWIAAFGFMMIVCLNTWIAEWIGFCLIGMGASNIVPILFSISGKFHSSSTALTIVTTLGYVGALIGPGFIGFLAQATTLSFALGSISFLLISVALCGRLALPSLVKT